MVSDIVRVLSTAVAAAVLFTSALLAGDGVVALQTADPSCRKDYSHLPEEDRPIYEDCGNGTVTDNRTGLVWLANTDCWGALPWLDAMMVVAGLGDLADSDPDDCGLSDGSSPSEWRLASKTEWAAMVADAVSLGCTGVNGPTITSDDENFCWNVETGLFSSFSGVQSSSYWSSTTLAANAAGVWLVGMNNGTVFGDGKADSGRVWPVRGGQ